MGWVFLDVAKSVVNVIADVLYDGAEFYMSYISAYVNVQTTLAVLLALFVVVLTTYYYRQRQSRVAETAESAFRSSAAGKEDDKAPRFRKREKLEFYARKTLHRLSIEDDVPSEPSKRKKWNQRLVKRLKERFRRVVKPTLPSISTPNSLLEEDERADDAMEQNLPLEIVLMLKSVKVFWDFEKPLFLELCKHVETIELRSGECLFRVGDPDDSIYVVQDGIIHIVAIDNDGQKPSEVVDVFAGSLDEHTDVTSAAASRGEYVINEVTRAGTIHSLLSVLDSVIGNTPCHNNVYARAARDSVVLRLSTRALRSVFDRHPDAIGRFVQLLATRIQRVTILAVSTYLGLSAELLTHREIADSNLGVLRVKFEQFASLLFPRLTVSQRHESQTAAGANEAGTAAATHAENFPPYFRSRSGSSSHRPRPESPATAMRTPTRQANSHVVHRSASSPHMYGVLPTSVASVQQTLQEEANAGVNFSPARNRAAQATAGREKERRHSADIDWFVAELANRRTSDGAGGVSEGDLVTIPSPEEVLASGEAPSYRHYYRARLRQLKAHANAMKAKHGSTTSSWITPNRFSILDQPVAFDLLEPGLSAAVASPKDPEMEGESPSVKPKPRDALLSIIVTDIANVLGVSDPNILVGRVHVGFVRGGTLLTKQSDVRASLFIVLNGELIVSQQPASVDVADSTQQRNLFVARSGELVGVLTALSNEPSIYTIKARKDSILACIAHADIEALIEREPRVALCLADSFLKRTDRAVRAIDFALDWMHADAGHALYRQHEPADSLYVLLSGRLRSVRTVNNSEKQLVAEFGRGELLGLLEVLTQAGERQTTMIAVRDSELVRVPQGLLNMIRTKYPAVVARRLLALISERVISRPLSASAADREGVIVPKNRTVVQSAPIAGEDQEKAAHGRPSSHAAGELPTLLMLPSIFAQTPLEAGSAVSGGASTRRAQFNTIAIVPYSEQTPLQAFTLELQLALSTMVSCLRLTSEIVLRRLGAKALDSGQNYRLIGWLAEQEENYETILYQCDMRSTAWTKKCLRQADCVLIVASASQKEHEPGVLEKEIAASALKARKLLVLLHTDDEQYVVPGSTFEWLAPRVNFVSAHMHIRCPKRIFSRRRGEKLLGVFGGLYEQPFDGLSDVARLARYLLGRSVALVLGGGGARGIAHVGLLRALREARVPVDCVAGTSIGSLMGALLAQEQDAVRAQHKAKLFAAEMSSTWHQLLDLTLPFVSWFTGERFNDVLRRLFGERQIEDLWLPYFCVTTDISSSRMKVHQTGSLWRYVRGSMSLAGFVPPICDPVDGAYLLDGGYLNNLPVDVMHQLHTSSVAHILACDVGSQDDTDLTVYGDSLSGLWLLLRRLNPFQKTPLRIPSMNDIQWRLAYVCCVRHLELVKQSGVCEYLRPPVDRYKTLQFRCFDEIFDVGYRYAKHMIAQWETSGFAKQLRAAADVRACLREHRRGTRRRPLLRPAPAAVAASHLHADRGVVHSATVPDFPTSAIVKRNLIDSSASPLPARQISLPDAGGSGDDDDDEFERDSDEALLDFDDFDFDDFDDDDDEALELGGYDSEHAPAMRGNRKSQVGAGNTVSGTSTSAGETLRGISNAVTTMSDPETWDLNSSHHSAHSVRLGSLPLDASQCTETDPNSSAPESGRQSPQRTRGARLSDVGQRRVQFQL